MCFLVKCQQKHVARDCMIHLPNALAMAMLSSIPIREMTTNPSLISWNQGTGDILVYVVGLLLGFVTVWM